MPMLDSPALDTPRHARTGVLRWWPAIAAAFGIAGLAWAGSPAVFAVAALLVICSLALELGGWAEHSRAHGRKLGTAALCGALAGAAVIGVAHWRGIEGPAPDRIALGR